MTNGGKNGSLSTDAGRVDPVLLERRLTTLEQGIIRIEVGIGHIEKGIDDDRKSQNERTRAETKRNAIHMDRVDASLIELREQTASFSTRWETHEDEHQGMKKRNIVLDVLSGAVAVVIAVIFGRTP